MFDDNRYNETDDLLRSILSQGEEDVPAHVWEGVSSQLDRISTRKTVMLWFRRTAVAAAAAAVVAVGVFTDWTANGDIVSPAVGSGLIAVADTPLIHTGHDLDAPAALSEGRNVYMADAAEEVAEAVTLAEELTAAAEGPSASSEEPVTEPPHAQDKSAYSDKTESVDLWPVEWDDEDDSKIRNRRRTSIVLAGITGTNSTQSKGLSPLRRPSMSTTKPETGVEQKSSESTYGLPVSFGAGVKFDLNDRWALGIGANYTILTRKFFGTYTLVNSEGHIEESISSDIRNAQQYIGIPVNAFFNIVDNDYLNFYTYAGGTVERCFSDKYDILNTEYIYDGSVKGVQLSANIGLGVEFMLGRHLGLYMDPSLRYYFDCGQPKSIRTAQPLMMGIEMGLRVNL